MPSGYSAVPQAVIRTLRVVMGWVSVVALMAGNAWVGTSVLAF